MAEYIEREATIDEIAGTTWHHISCQKKLVEGAACEADALYKATDIYNVIKSAPTADVVEVRHGKWLTWEEQFPDRKPTKKNNLGVFCNNCHNHADNMTDYCPNCGAKMDGDTNDEL